MAPLYLETRLLGIVGHVLLAGDGVLIAAIEATAVFVAFAVVGCSRQSP